MSFFDKIKNGLSKTATTISQVFVGATELDEDFYDDLEESLILTDMGVEVAAEAADALRRRVKKEGIKTAEEAKAALRALLCEMLQVGSAELELSKKPAVILVIGVNGVGKTTTIPSVRSHIR